MGVSTVAKSRKTNKAKVEIEVFDALVEIPTMKTGHYATRRLQASLDRKQCTGLRMVFDGLQYAGAELADGSQVRNAQDAVRWILEQVYDSVEESESNQSSK